MMERLIIKLSWKSPEMSAHSHLYFHPECVIEGSDTWKKNVIVRALQGEVVERHREGRLDDEVCAITPRDVHYEANCVSCGGLLREPPAHNNKGEWRTKGEARGTTD